MSSSKIEEVGEARRSMNAIEGNKNIILRALLSAFCSSIENNIWQSKEKNHFLFVLLSIHNIKTL